jgi:hypothetical protein
MHPRSGRRISDISRVICHGQLQAPCYAVGPRARHASHYCTAMLDGPGYHNRQPILAANIYKLLYSLSPTTYDEIAPMIEYWIEYVLTEQFTTTDDLVERIAPVAWAPCSPRPDISRFLKEFHEAPQRSERARSFVDELCLHVLRWFAIAAADNLSVHKNSSVTNGGLEGFRRVASFVGHLIERGLLTDDLVRRHLIKPLITHRNYDDYRANAIYQLFDVAGNTLLQGLLEPGDVQVCFERLKTLTGKSTDLGTARLDVRCDSHFDAPHYGLTCTPGTSQNPCCMVAAQRGGTAKECRGN